LTIADWKLTVEGRAVAGKKRRISEHEAGEATPCDECATEMRLLQRAQELKDEHGLEGRELLESVLNSFHQEHELEQMWLRGPRHKKK
jgi:hypothetical protein